MAVGAASVSLFAVLTVLVHGVRFNVNPLSLPTYLILTIIFITSGSILVSYISARAYLGERLPSMLFLGSAALIFGLTSLIAAVSALMSSGRSGTNGATTVFIIGVSVSALAHLASVGTRKSGDRAKRGTVRLVALEFALVFVLVGAATAVAFSGTLPTFLVPGTGDTAIAKGMLVVSILAMAFAALAVARPSIASPVLSWYCSALAMMVVGLVGILLSNWVFEAADFIVGRTALSIAGLFLVLSVRSAETSPPLDPDSALLEIFKPATRESRPPPAPQPDLEDGNASLYERSMLLEADPSSNFERAVKAFAEEMASTGRVVFVFTSKGSPVSLLLRQVEGVRFFIFADVSYPKASGEKEVLVPATDLSAILNVVSETVTDKREPRKAIVFDNISSLILEKGFNDVYKFLRQMNEIASGGDVVTLFVMLEGAHDEQTVNLVRNLYSGQLGYDSSGLRSKKR